MKSETRCAWETISSMVSPASLTRRAPASMSLVLAWISALISLAASALRWASARTSPATTAKPRPCSPARAASTAALSASRLVWKAMPSMTLTMSAIRRALVVMVPMVATIWSMDWPPRRAAALASLASSPALRAVWALEWTMEVISSMEAAVWATLAATCSVWPCR